MITRVFKILHGLHHISLVVLKYVHAHLIIHKARTTYVTLDEKTTTILSTYSSHLAYSIKKQ